MVPAKQVYLGDAQTIKLILSGVILATFGVTTVLQVAEVKRKSSTFASKGVGDEIGQLHFEVETGNVICRGGRRAVRLTRTGTALR